MNGIYNLRLDSDAPKAARQARVEPVGKPLNEHDFDRLGGGSKVSDRNRMCDGGASEPE